MKKIGSLLVALSIWLFGGVSASVDQRVVELGDSVVLTLSSTFDGTIFPMVDDIGGVDVLSSSNSTSISYINGRQSYVKKLLLTFSPTQDMTIPSFTIRAKNKNYKTSPIKIKVVKNKISNQNSSDFIYTMSVDKKSAYRLEAINLSLKFKRLKSATLLDLEFYEPKFDSFWFKKLEDEKSYEEGEYIVHELKYVLYPQKSGIITLSPNHIKLAIPKPSRDAFGYIINIPKYKKIYTNNLTIDVKPLPKGVKLVGNYTLKAKISAKKAKSGEAIKYKLIIKGDGNFDDIEKFSIDIPDATVYSDKPVKKQSFSNGKIASSFVQTFAIISDKSYTIPEFKLKYFDPTSMQIKSIKTKPVPITITDSKDSIVNISQKGINNSALVVKNLWQDRLLFFSMGVLFALFLYFVVRFFRIKTSRGSKKKIQTDERELLKQLMPHAHDTEASNHIRLLEQNIYFGNKNKIDKKRINHIIIPQENQTTI